MIKFFNFFLDSVEAQFNKEHLFLLINELFNVLWSHLLFTAWERNSTLSDMHCRANSTSLYTIKVVYIVLHLCWSYISILYTAQRLSRCWCFFVPDLQVPSSFLSLLSLLFFGLSCDKYFLIIESSEWRCWSCHQFLWLSIALLLWSSSNSSSICLPFPSFHHVLLLGLIRLGPSSKRFNFFHLSYYLFL